MTATSNRLQVLEDGMEIKPSHILVGDSLVWHQNREFCDRNKNRRLCYLRARVEDMIDKVEVLFGTLLRSLVLVLVGTNNVV